MEFTEYCWPCPRSPGLKRPSGACYEERNRNRDMMKNLHRQDACFPVRFKNIQVGWQGM